MITKNGVKMSKSKGNTVSPDDLIRDYGADTVRLYTLFIGPPEKDAEWSDRGVEGAYRFLGRVWRLVEKVRSLNSPLTTHHSPLKEESALRRKTHQTIKKVTEDLDGGFHFNTAVSAVMELVNQSYEVSALSESGKCGVGALKDAVEAAVMLLAPFVPHIAEEMWHSLGKKNSIFRCEWPSYDKDLIAADTISIPVQINGKLRSKVEVPFDITEDALKEAVLAESGVQRWIKDARVKKFVVVPKKLVNIVV
jgi:leucyl-tRNA synthetase